MRLQWKLTSYATINGRKLINTALLRSKRERERERERERKREREVEEENRCKSVKKFNIKV